MITVLDLKYLKGEYLDYVRISFSLLLEYWMKRMVLCFFFSPDEKTNLQEEKIFTLSMQLLSGKNKHVQDRYCYHPTE